MKAKKLFINVAIVILVAVFIFSAVKLISALSEYNKADKFYSELNDRFVVPVPPQFTAESSHAPSQDGSAPTEDASPLPSGESAPIAVDFDALTAYNSDVVGWLYCEDTVMNYPVAQSDDNSFYLRRSLEKKYLVTGTIFADYRCSVPGEDINYLIFGHDMDNGTIFGMLKNFSDKKYMASHPVLWYLTPDADYKIEVYAGITVDAHNDIYNVGQEADDFISHITDLAATGTVTDGFELTNDDRLMMLSTCSDEFENARFILVGKVTVSN